MRVLLTDGLCFYSGALRLTYGIDSFELHNVSIGHSYLKDKSKVKRYYVAHAYDPTSD